MQTTRTPLHKGWQIRESQIRDRFTSHVDWIPAEVPGHVHLDLARAGVIPDPFQRMHERTCAWVDETDWDYRLIFSAEVGRPLSYLVFHGLDTVADVRLNGDLAAASSNMFVPLEVPLEGRLLDGQNELVVTFHSAIRVGEARRRAWEDAGEPSVPEHWFTWGPRAFVRKAQYMFGWDWGPELVSCGIWKPVQLVTVPVARLLEWRYELLELNAERAVLRITQTVERASDEVRQPLTFRFTCEGAAPVETLVPATVGRIAVTVEVVVAKPRLWWPNGHGDGPHLLTANRELISQGSVVDAAGSRLGLRRLELHRTPDAYGESFEFQVNGTPLFCKGANWIPADCFPSRLEHDQGRRKVVGLLRAARDAGVNMLRVWGGGLYESEAFYDTCDELGILVWQDFAFSCGYYPDTGEYAEEARREAAAAVRRIRNHPSLALWCGNNENQMIFYGLPGVGDPPRFLGQKLFDEVLPSVVAAEDPATPYWPGSPFGGLDPNDYNTGDAHFWDVWHGRGDWVHYREAAPRFVSEFGFSASCGLRAWRTCLADADYRVDSPVVRWHDKTRKGYATYLDLISKHFPQPRSLEDLVYYGQANQAEALKCAVEYWRSQSHRCRGALFWQWNDCWPVQSWSVLDHAGEPKAAYYFAARFFAPVLVSLQKEGECVAAVVANDLAEPLAGSLRLAVLSFDGEVLRETEEQVYVTERGTQHAAELPLDGLTPHSRDVFVHALLSPYDHESAGPADNVLFLAEPKDLRLAAPEISVECMRIEEGQALLRLSSKRIAPYVWLSLPESVAPEPRCFSDNWFHLLPGVSKDVQVRTRPDITADEVLAQLRVRSL